MPEPTPTVAGLPFGWGAIASFAGLIINVIIARPLIAWLRDRPRMRELSQSADERLRDDLLKRVETLEKKLEEERVSHEAIVGLMRHRLNNADQCLEALLMLLEAADDLPEKVKRAVTVAKDMRSRQREAEQRERDAVTAAHLAKAGVST